MSVVFGYSNPKDLKVSEGVLSLGFNLLQSVLSAVICYAIPTKIQTAFRTYSTLLPAYIEAMVTEHRINVREPFHPIGLPNNLTFPYDLPNISVSFNGQPPSDIESMLSGAGAKKENIKGTPVYLVRNPKVDLIHSLMKVSGVNKTCPAPDQFVNLSALTYVGLVRKIFSGFFLVNHYPAFKDDEHMNDVTSLKMLAGGVIGAKRKATESAGYQGRPEHREESDSEEEVQMEEEEDEQISREQLESDKIEWALPSGTLYNKGWGSVNDLGSTGGLWFPFVPELQLYDHKGVPEVILKYFMGCLGQSTDQIRQMFSDLRSAWGVVKSTDAGKMLGHMAKCIDLGLQAQARVFPIFSGEIYEGCVLSGAGFTIVVEDRRYTAKPASELSEILVSANKSQKALEAIGVLAKVDMKAAFPDSTKVPPMMKLKRVMMLAEVSEKSKDEILKLSSKLRLPAFWALNPSSIITALELCRKSSWEDFPDDAPISPSMLFEKDVVALAWSCFGQMAPSPRFPNAPMRQLSDNKFPKHIAFTSRVFNEALADIKEVLRTKAMTIPSTNKRSSLHKDRIFTDRSAANILAALRATADIVVNTGREDSAMAIVGEGPEILGDF